MKTFREYLAECKKLYSFKIKVAGELPENFESDIKERLEKYKVITFEKMSTTPVQKVPLDFPHLENKEVTIYDVVLEYPVTSPEIVSEMAGIGINDDCFRVRGSGEPSEIDQITMQVEPTGDAVLNDSTYSETEKIKHKDYFGNDFNRGFLKDLEKTAKERKKEGQQVEYKLEKPKHDKTGAKSALGSK